MENAKKIWIDYRTGAISEKKAVNLLLELLFRNKYEFGLSAFDDDSFSDFLIFMNTRFETILRKYNPEISDFKTYLHSVINLTAFWWKRKSQEKQVNSYCCQSLCIEENLNTMGFSIEEKDFYIEEPQAENLMPVSTLAKAALRNLNLQPKKRNHTITKRRAKEIIKVLALKSCNNITDQQIDVVSEITGIPSEEFHRMVSQAEESIILKKDRISQLQNRRNFAYFQRKRKILRESNLRERFPDLYCNEEASREDVRWEKAVADLSEAAESLVPSNKTIAGLLNMSARKVKTILDEAKENFSSTSIVNHLTE